MALATLAQVKTHIGITGTTDDAKISRILAGVEHAIARECRRVVGEVNGLVEAAWTERLTAIGATILLSAYPVIGTITVKESSDYDFDAAETLVEDTDYLVDRHSGIVTRLGCNWIADRLGVRVAYTGGYEAAGANHVSGHQAMPADLTSAAILQTVFEYKRAGQEGIASMAAGGGNVTMYQPEGLLPGVRKLIAPFRRMI